MPIQRPFLTLLVSSAWAVPCVAQPQFSFQPLPELPGGASQAVNINAPVAIDGGDGVDTIVVVGRSLDADLVNKAVVWTKGVGQPWEIEPLPDPFGNTESVATGMSCFDIAVELEEIFCSIGGSAQDGKGVSQPVVWIREGKGLWLPELPPIPPGFNSGEITGAGGKEVDNAWEVTYVGWVDQSEDAAPRHAIRWLRHEAGLWSVTLLPDFGPGFYSVALAVSVSLADPNTMIGGHAQPDSGFGQLPCVWEEQPGGALQRIDLPLIPGAYLGSVNDASPMDDDGHGSHCAVGYNASIAGLADLYRGVLHRRVGGLWTSPLSLPPAAGLRDSRASAIAASNATFFDGLTVVGHSYVEVNPGSERATLWEIAPDESMFVYDVNDLTVDLPPGVSLSAMAGGFARNYDPIFFAGTFTDDKSPSTPHAAFLIRLCGTDCNKNGQDDCIDLYAGTSGDANANGVPDECEPPLFKFAALPELPGGQSVVLGSATAAGGDGPLTIPWDFGGFCGQALDGDGIWKGAVWLFYPGCLPFEGWMLETLPNPLGDFAAAATTLTIYGTEPIAAFAAGYVSNEEVWNHPAFWVRQAAGDWTAELPTPPPPYDSGAFLASRTGNGTVTSSPLAIFCGWVGQKAGPEPHHAVACDMISDGGGWTAIWSLLPDYGPGFFSEATSIAVDPVDQGDPEDDRRIIGGSVQTDSSPQAPCVWQEIAGGGFELIELPMIPGAYRGEVKGSYKPGSGISFSAVGYNTTPALPDDAVQAVLYRATTPLPSPVEFLLLPPLVDCPYGRAHSVIPGTSNSPGGLTIVGESFGCPTPSGAVATLWEVEADNSITVYNLNEQTVNLPPSVMLIAAAALAINIEVSTTQSIGGSSITDMPSGAVAAAGPGGGPHGFALTQIVRGNCCGRDDQNQAFCLNISDIHDCRPVYGGQAVADCSECDLPTPEREAGGVDKNRFASFVVPTATAAAETAIRVRLASLHHPSDPPPGTPSFATFEDAYRYLNSFPALRICVGGSNPVAACTTDAQCMDGGSCQTQLHTCPDSPAHGTTFRCAKLGCQPEYRDWAGELVGSVVHVTGDSVIPDSTYELSQIGPSCGFAPAANSCIAGSTIMSLATATLGDIAGPANGPPDGVANVLDVSATVNKVRDLSTAFFEPRGWLKSKNPDPMADAVNVLEISLCVDAVLLKPYPASYTIDACP